MTLFRALALTACAWALSAGGGVAGGGDDGRGGAMSVHDASQRSLFPAIAVPRVTKRRLSPGPNLAHHDLIMTPPELARRIVDYYAPRGRLLDPCRGQGAFYNAMLSHSDDVRWCEVAEGRTS